MKFEVTAEKGEVSNRPEVALDALAKVLFADGLEAEEWESTLAKALGGLPQRGSPSFKVLMEAVAEGRKIFETGMAAARAEVQEVLRRAAKKADKKHYRDQL